MRLSQNLFYLLLFLLSNALIWWALQANQEKRIEAELQSFTRMEMAIVESVAEKSRLWLEHRLGERVPLEVAEQELFRQFVDPIKLLKQGDAWLFRKGYSVYDPSGDFPQMYRGKSIEQIFSVQQSFGALHYDKLVDGVMLCNRGSDWFQWLPEKGPEYAAWTSFKAGGTIWTLGLSTPKSEILDSSGLQKEFQRNRLAGIGVSALTLLALLLAIYGRYRESLYIRKLTHEIADRATVEQRLRESEDRYRRLFANSKAVQLLVDAGSGQLVDANEAASQFYGLHRNDLVKLKVSDINTLSSTQMKEEMQRAEQENRSYYLMRHKLANGELRDVEVYSNPIRLEGRRLIYTIIHDVTERRRMEEKIRFMGSHDPLTRLPNRNLLWDRLGMAIELAKRNEGKLAVLFLDLDGFKPVNDELGHSAGDRVLGNVARRLQQCIRGTDTVARFGGDEFVVLLTEVEGREAIEGVARKLLETIGEPMELSGRELQVGCSIGIASYPKDGRDPEALLGAADQAMYQAKEEGKNRYHFSQPSPQSELFG